MVRMTCPSCAKPRRLRSLLQPVLEELRLKNFPLLSPSPPSPRPSRRPNSANHPRPSGRSTPDESTKPPASEREYSRGIDLLLYSDLLSDSDLHSDLATILNIIRSSYNPQHRTPPPDSHTMYQSSVLPHGPTRQSTGLQSTEDIQTMKQRPARRFQPIPYWVKLDPAVHRMSEKLNLPVRNFAEAVREKLRRAGKLDMATKEVERLRSEYTKEVMDPCDSVQPPLVGPLAKEYATPNPENVAHLPELSSQQEQAKLPEGFVCSNNVEFIKQLDRQAKVYYNTVKPLPQKEIIANGLQYMNDEAFVAFNYYIAEKDLSEGLDYKFGELLHHCFTFEEHGKVYSHYNFTIEMKKKDEQCWTSNRYFAEAKLMRGVKYYFCSPLEATDDGQCYSCMDQGANELKHPSGGGYEKGHKGYGSHCGYADGSDDGECGMRHIHKGYGSHFWYADGSDDDECV